MLPFQVVDGIEEIYLLCSGLLAMPFLLMSSPLTTLFLFTGCAWEYGAVSSWQKSSVLTMHRFQYIKVISLSLSLSLSQVLTLLLSLSILFLPPFLACSLAVSFSPSLSFLEISLPKNKNKIVLCFELFCRSDEYCFTYMGRVLKCVFMSDRV